MAADSASRSGRCVEIGGELALLEERGGALLEHSALDHCRINGEQLLIGDE